MWDVDGRLDRRMKCDENNTRDTTRDGFVWHNMRSASIY